MAHPSLSVVLPVHNAEQTLATRVTELLDILPDLTTHFEVLVINDGSTDHTEEVAYDLAREYPQIRVTRHPMRRGQRGAVETGLAETTGEILMVHDEQATIDSSRLLRLWELRNDQALLEEPPALRLSRTVMQRLAAWGVRLEEPTPEGGTSGVQLIRRPRSAASPRLPASRNTRADAPASQRDQTAPRFIHRDRSRSVPRKS